MLIAYSLRYTRRKAKRLRWCSVTSLGRRELNPGAPSGGPRVAATRNCRAHQGRACAAVGRGVGGAARGPWPRARAGTARGGAAAEGPSGDGAGCREGGPAAAEGPSGDGAGGSWGEVRRAMAREGGTATVRMGCMAACRAVRGPAARRMASSRRSASPIADALLQELPRHNAPKGGRGNTPSQDTYPRMVHTESQETPKKERGAHIS